MMTLYRAGMAWADPELERLTDAAVADRLRTHFGVPPSAGLLDLATVARGNPAALSELIRGLGEDGLIVVGRGQARLRVWELPTRFQSLVYGQLRQVSDRTRQLVQVASMVGTSSALLDLADLLGETAAGLLPAAQEALAVGLLFGHDGRLTFSHELVRVAVAATLAPVVRQAVLHDIDRFGAASSTGTPPGPTRTVSGWSSLTDTERTIAQLVSQGLTNRQIASRVFLSAHTVNYHLRQTFRKLEIHSRSQLAHLVQASLIPAGAAATRDSVRVRVP